jgi:para-aminobenzoate synthetase component 1
VVDGGPVAVVRDGRDVIVCTDAVEHVAAHGDAGLQALDHMWAGDGFWVGALAYDLGRVIERVDIDTDTDGHTDGRPNRDDRGFAHVAFTRFATQTRFTPNSTNPESADTPSDASHRDRALGGMASSLSRNEHAAAVAAVHHHLSAGDCYQVNLTRRLHTRRRAEPRALFAALASRHPAPHAALVELDGIALVSASPERFLRVEDGAVETRPIKGTHASAECLMASGKDLAEHVMILDMARNDLGRVCELGSVHVPALAALERHPGLAHLVSTVRGHLRSDASLADLVRATFPPASITGAPKPRVMQIIEALEPVHRGYYCGAIGWIDGAAARADLAVGIRTFVVSERGTDLGVGGGVVADSTAAGEWDETSLKAARLLEAAGAYEIESGADRPARRSVATAGAPR